jgi:hypothetical protein
MQDSELRDNSKRLLTSIINVQIFTREIWCRNVPIPMQAYGLLTTRRGRYLTSPRILRQRPQVIWHAGLFAASSRVSTQGRPESGRTSESGCELTRKGSANYKALTETGCPQRERTHRKPGFSWGREHSQDWVLSAGARTHAKRVQRKAEANSPTGGFA